MAESGAPHDLAHPHTAPHPETLNARLITHGISIEEACQKIFPLLPQIKSGASQLNLLQLSLALDWKLRHSQQA